MSPVCSEKYSINSYQKNACNALLAISVSLTTTAAHSDTLIRCPDWEQLVAVNEGRAVLRKASPGVDFDALIKVAASAKAASGLASTPR